MPFSRTILERGLQELEKQPSMPSWLGEAPLNDGLPDILYRYLGKIYTRWSPAPEVEESWHLIRISQEYTKVVLQIIAEISPLGNYFLSFCFQTRDGTIHTKESGSIYTCNDRC